MTQKIFEWPKWLNNEFYPTEKLIQRMSNNKVGPQTNKCQNKRLGPTTDGFNEIK